MQTVKISPFISLFSFLIELYCNSWGNSLQNAFNEYKLEHKLTAHVLGSLPPSNKKNAWKSSFWNLPSEAKHQNKLIEEEIKIKKNIPYYSIPNTVSIIGMLCSTF